MRASVVTEEALSLDCKGFIFISRQASTKVLEEVYDTVTFIYPHVTAWS